jgi:flagellar hook-length control protein FliK
MADINTSSQSYFQGIQGSRPLGYDARVAENGEIGIGGSSFSEYLSRIDEAHSEESRRTLDYDRANYVEEKSLDHDPYDSSETMEAATLKGRDSARNADNSAPREKTGAQNGEADSCHVENKESSSPGNEAGEKVEGHEGKGDKGASASSPSSVSEDRAKQPSSTQGADTGARTAVRKIPLSDAEVGKAPAEEKGRLSIALEDGEKKKGETGDLRVSAKISKETGQSAGEKSPVELRKKQESSTAGNRESAAIQAGGTIIMKPEKSGTESVSAKKSEKGETSVEAGETLRKKSPSAAGPRETDAPSRLTIVDERSRKPSAEEPAKESKQVGNRSEGSDRDSGESRVSFSSLQGKPGQVSVSANEQGDSSLQVIQVHLRSENLPGSVTENAGSVDRRDLQNQLSQQLREQLSSEIVKKSSILVRNNGSGEIRLELKPEQLGNVRIRLTLENNNIAGKILVENNSVKEAFDQNLQQLYRAFKEHGFGDATLNVSVGDHRQRQPQDAHTTAVQGGYRNNLTVSVENGAGTVLRTGYESRLVDMLA